MSNWPDTEAQLHFVDNEAVVVGITAGVLWQITGPIITPGGQPEPWDCKYTFFRLPEYTIILTAPAA